MSIDTILIYTIIFGIIYMWCHHSGFFQMIRKVFYGTAKFQKTEQMPRPKKPLLASWSDIDPSEGLGNFTFFNGNIYFQNKGDLYVIEGGADNLHDLENFPLYMLGSSKSTPDE